MRNWLVLGLLVMSLGVGGSFIYAIHRSGTPQLANSAGFICPLTGQELPCQRCCPLNQRKSNQESAAGVAFNQGCCVR